jgi:hypothetical protein
MKIAIRKEPGHIPGSGYHYWLFPAPMGDGQFLPAHFEMMGYIVAEVSDEDGARLITEARSALGHQFEIAKLAEDKLAKRTE